MIMRNAYSKPNHIVACVYVSSEIQNTDLVGVLYKSGRCYLPCKLHCLAFAIDDDFDFAGVFELLFDA